MTSISPVKTNSKFNLRKILVRPEKPYVHPYAGGVMLGIVLFLAFLITRNGLGASGGMNRLVAGVEDALVPGHIDRTPYLLKLAGGSLNPLDDWSVPVLLGALVGGAAAGLLNGRTKIEINKGPQVSNRTRLITAFIGGALFAYGARMARGCTSGQALSGGAALSAGSWALMMCIFAGAYGLAYFVRKLWN
ncbi:MAG: YeeE/YedE family protein [Anaerolineaceae bacterium]|nr:YeeE/YedE family protein [Anaerolineaceae bacterium]